MFFKSLLFSTCFLFGFQPAQQPVSFDTFCTRFVNDYKKLGINDLQLGYVQNLQSIQDGAGVQRQFDFFGNIQQEIKHYDAKKLNDLQRQDYELIVYETNINLERLQLEKKWLALPKRNITDSGIYHQPDGRLWYAYFLKKWLGDEVTPKQIYQFGL